MSEANSMDCRVKPLSAAQEKVLKFLSKDPNRLPRQIAGYGAAPHLSAARALVRRGLARAGTKTGHYGITSAGVEHLRLNDYKYRIKPEPIKTERYRRWISKTNAFGIIRHCVQSHSENGPPKEVIENHSIFVRWIDDEWQEGIDVNA